MANKIFIYRFSSTGTVNMRAAEALKPFYVAYPSQAIICRTPFGMLTNMISDFSAQEIFEALVEANIGDHFMVIEVDETDTPVVTLSSNGINTTMPGGNTNVEVRIDHAKIDRTKTREQLTAELDALIEKVGISGRNSLTPIEMARLDHLSQL
jgi:hypothetical protein